VDVVVEEGLTCSRWICGWDELLYVAGHGSVWGLVGDVCTAGSGSWGDATVGVCSLVLAVGCGEGLHCELPSAAFSIKLPTDVVLPFPVCKGSP
jgi:hypothetical protein